MTTGQQAASLDVIYLDNHLLVVSKPPGVLVQGDHTGDRTLLDVGKEFVKQEYNKLGNVFLGLVHRLDRPTSGVVAFARTSKSASRLSDQFRTRSVRKVYWAVLEGETPPQGDMKDEIVRDGPTSRVEDGGQAAHLRYRTRGVRENLSWVEVEPTTGRHHQIRIQFAHRGHPVLGDHRYGSKAALPDRAIALHARSLTLTHPTRKEEMTFEADPPEFWPRHFLQD